MDELVARCAGLDVHRDTVVATVRSPKLTGAGRRVMTRTFATTTAGLSALGDWLVEEAVDRVGMESTGVYWRPVFFALEDRLPRVWLLNAEHLRNVPGRKTDVADSAWIAQLVEHGLVAPSFVPPAAIRELRDWTRHRRVLVEERTRTVQRLDKTLQDAGIKLTSVASSLLTKSGRAILDALLAGVADPVALADLARGRLRSKIPALREALAGQFRVAHHGVLVAQMLAHVDFLEESIGELDGRIDTAVERFEPVLARVQTIPGVARKTAVCLLAEIGADMSVFPTAAHLASWAGICPGNNASGGRRPRRAHPARLGLAQDRAHRSRPRRRADQGHLPRRASRFDPRPAGHVQSDRRDPSRPAHRLLAHRRRRSRLPGTGRRLGDAPALTRTPDPPTGTATRSSRPPGPPHRRRLIDQVVPAVGEGFTLQSPSTATWWRCGCSSDRRDELAHARTQTVSRLHRLLLELIPGGAPRFLSANQARALLASVRPRDVAGRTRRRLAAELPAEIVVLDRKLKASDTQLREAVTAAGTGLLDLYGLGPVGAARLLGDVGNVCRFASKAHFASWTGTAPIDAILRRTTPPTALPRRQRPHQPGPAQSWPSSRSATTHPEGSTTEGTRRRQDPAGSPPLPQTATVRCGLPATGRRHRNSREDGPGRTLGGDYKLQRGQPNPDS
jgi:transposase